MSNKNIKIYGQLESGVSGGFLTELSQIKDYDKLISSVVYADGYINFLNADKTQVASLSAEPFLKDGMLNSVSISGSNLVFSFNTDAGKSEISVPLSDIFTPGNYYSKEELESRPIVRVFEGFTEDEPTGSAPDNTSGRVLYSNKKHKFCLKTETNSFLNWPGVDSFMNSENGTPSKPLSSVLFYDKIGRKTYFFDGTSLLPLFDKDDDITVLMNEVFPLELTVRAGQSLIEFDGSAHQVKFSITTKRKGSSVVAETMTFTPSNGEPDTIVPNNSLTERTIEVSDLGKTTLTVQASYQGVSKTASANVEMILPIYVGFADKDNSLADIIQGDTVEKHISKNLNSLTSLDNQEDGANLIIALPSNLTLKKITSGGFDVPMDQKTDAIAVGNETCSYKVYYSSNMMAAGLIESLVITI